MPREAGSAGLISCHRSLLCLQIVTIPDSARRPKVPLYPGKVTPGPAYHAAVRAWGRGSGTEPLPCLGAQPPTQELTAPSFFSISSISSIQTMVRNPASFSSVSSRQAWRGRQVSSGGSGQPHLRPPQVCAPAYLHLVESTLQFPVLARELPCTADISLLQDTDGPR